MQAARRKSRIIPLNRYKISMYSVSGNSQPRGKQIHAHTRPCLPTSYLYRYVSLSYCFTTQETLGVLVPDEIK